LRSTLIYILYRALGVAGLPFILIYFVWRGLRNRAYFRRLPERLGFLPTDFSQTAPGAIWLHAVSVGEVLSSVQLLARLRQAAPYARLFVSTTTLAGRATAESKLKGLADGVFYTPFDFCFAVRRVLRTLRPAVVVVMETEIWPNLYHESKRAGCGLLVLNGRISDRAIGRYRALRWFFRAVLESPDAILAQTEVSRTRYLDLGAPAERVRTAGNLKYDFDPDKFVVSESIISFLQEVRPAQVVIAASTMPPLVTGDVDEDDVVIDAFQRLAAERPGLLLILVPRRPERFDVAARKLEAAGIPFLRRSALAPGASLATPCVLLLDTIGELSGLFRLADVVFMGGTLARRGGHNILEPAFFARPVVVGPHMENFPEIAAEFSAARAMVEISAPAELAAAVEALLYDPARSAQIGERAQRLAGAQRGATQTAVAEILRLHGGAVPRFRPVWPVGWVLWLPSRLWNWGARWKRGRDLARRGRLDAPVISVGGIGAGGAGKTPFVAWLAERLKARGHHPAILTRGYRRRHPEAVTLLAAGEPAPYERTGDEAQILLRSGAAPVGIGSDRLAAGRALAKRFSLDLFLLDDGFQHHRLERDLDIVLIDALDPFAGHAAIPLGRLREPLEALARAGIFVITRAAPHRTFAGLEHSLAAANPRAEIFTSRVAPREWVSLSSAHTWPPAALPFDRVAAFCGLANPASFWQTLDELGCRPATRWEFSDHHVYSPRQLRHLAAEARSLGVQALLTTEKDLMNLGPGAATLLQPLDLCWLRVGVEVDGEDRLLAVVEEALNRGRRTRSSRPSRAPREF
jgi:3-deoxy-D-manno-octulosonic-acid transferase